jgi:type II secretory pathway pseudopilin PulG
MLKRSFSLAELMVSIVLIALVAGCLIMPARSALERARFDYGIRALAARLQLQRSCARSTDTIQCSQLKLENGSLIFLYEPAGSPIVIDGIEQLIVNGASYKAYDLKQLPGSGSAKVKIEIVGAATSGEKRLLET